METITEEPVIKAAEQEKLSAEELNARFHMLLQTHVRGFERIVNTQLTNTESAVLFCGAVESVAKEFKDIFLKVLHEEMYRAGRSKNQIRKILINLESVSQQIMTAKHTPAPPIQ